MLISRPTYWTPKANSTLRWSIILKTSFLLPKEVMEMLSSKNWIYLSKKLLCYLINNKSQQEVTTGLHPAN